MCIPCEAAKARLLAANILRETVEGRYGLGPALKAVFSPPPPSLDLQELAQRFDEK